MGIQLIGYVYDKDNNKKPYGISADRMPDIIASTENLVIVKHNNNYVHIPVYSQNK